MPGYPLGGIGTHYSDASVAVDVSDIIYQITPVDTPLYNAIPDKDSSGPWHQWARRELTTRASNTAPEGFTYDFSGAMTTPTYLGNVQQIVYKQVRVSNSEQAFAHYSITDSFGDQMALRMTEYKTDIEHALWSATLATGTATTANRQMQGIVEAMYSGITCMTGGKANQFSLSETVFNDMIQYGWDLGSEYRDVFCGGFMKRVISSYAGSGTRYLAADDNRLTKTISEYDSDFFSVKIHLSRDIPNAMYDGVLTNNTGHGVVFADLSMLAKAWRRRSVAKRVPETADSMDGIIVGELTLEYGHPCGHLVALNMTGP